MILNDFSAYIKIKFVRDTFWLTISKIIEILSAVVLNIFVAKIYGNVGLGIFNQVFAFFMIYSVVTNIGLSNSIIRFCSGVEKDTIHVLDSHNYITTIISIPIVILLLVIVYFFPNMFSNDDVAQSNIIVLMSLPLFLYNKNALSYYSARRHVNKVAFLRVVRWLINTILVVSFGLMKVTLVYTFFSFFIAESILYVYIYIDLKKVKKLVSKEKFNFNYLKFGFQTLIAEIISTVNEKLSIIITGYFLSKNDVGIYSLLITVISSLFFIQQVLMQNINPIISRLYNDNKIFELQCNINKVMKVSLSISFILAIFLLPAFYVLNRYILINQLNGYFTLFCLLLSGSLIFVPFAWSGGLLIMSSYTKENFYRTLIIMIINSSVLMTFGSILKLEGVVIATFLTNITALLVQYFAVKKLMNIDLLECLNFKPKLSIN